MKAIFIDHMGTIVKDNSDFAKEVTMKSYQHSDADSVDEILKFWSLTNKKVMDKAHGENFETIYNLSLKVFQKTADKFNVDYDIYELTNLMEKNWIYSPAFDDTQKFFEQVPLPIYILSNNDNKYLSASVENIGIDPTDTITSEKARTYKPKREFFQYALEMTGYKAEEVIHIGDSLENDIKGAKSVGIEPWLLDRGGKHPENKEAKTFQDLTEVLDEIRRRMK